jgi:hypothetical protein
LLQKKKFFSSFAIFFFVREWFNLLLKRDRREKATQKNKVQMAQTQPDLNLLLAKFEKYALNLEELQTLRHELQQCEQDEDCIALIEEVTQELDALTFDPKLAKKREIASAEYVPSPDNEEEGDEGEEGDDAEGDFLEETDSEVE